MNFNLKEVFMKYLILILMLLSFNCYAYKIGDKVELGGTSSCSACQEAKQLLISAHIKFTEISPTTDSNYIPQLYVNGKFKGYGVNVVEDYINEDQQNKTNSGNDDSGSWYMNTANPLSPLSPLSPLGAFDD